jgi:hypothetical protein
MSFDTKKSEVAGPEKVTELSTDVTYGDGKAKDPIVVHADPNDGDEAYVPCSFFAIVSFRNQPSLLFQLA